MKARVLPFLCGLLVPVSGLNGDDSPSEGRLPFYIGTYTGGQSEGIYRAELELGSGELSELRLVAKAENPSFVAVHPSGKFLYAVNEIGNYEGKSSGVVTAFSIDDDGGLSLLNQQPSGGAAPCHVVVDHSGKHVLCANYSGGNVMSLPIQDDGRLGEPTSLIQHEGSSVNPGRQKEPHAHSINVDPENRHAVVADLGLDQVFVYAFDSETGTLEAHPEGGVNMAPGAGPRHFAFHPSGTFAYVINELNCTITAMNYQADRGRLSVVRSWSTLPPDEELGEGMSTAEVIVSPNGKFLYGSNRGHDSIVVFQVLESGELQYVENEPSGGKTPRNFAVDPTGQFLLAENQSSDNIVVFRIDPETGALDATGNEMEVGSPVCIRFLPQP